MHIKRTLIIGPAADHRHRRQIAQVMLAVYAVKTQRIMTGAEKSDAEKIITLKLLCRPIDACITIPGDRISESIATCYRQSFVKLLDVLINDSYRSIRTDSMPALWAVEFHGAMVSYFDVHLAYNACIRLLVLH